MDYGHYSGRLLRWLVVGPVAVAGLVAVVAGGPLLLLWLGGNPLPSRWLSTGDLVELLTSPDDGQLLLWALTVVGWVAWAVIALSLLLELFAQLTGKRTPQVPGLGGPQRLASLLVAGVLAALTAPGIGHAHPAYLDETAAVATLDDQAPTGGRIGEILVPASPTAGPVSAQPTAQPTSASSTAGLASASSTAGPASVQLPAQPVSAPLAAQPTEPQPTTQAEQPQEQLVHEVAPGDWMWHIAGRYLGDELRYPEIAALNPQYAQQYADYPDHIQPGDRLVLPPDAYDRGPRPHATGELIGEPPPPAAGPEEPETGPGPDATPTPEPAAPEGSTGSDATPPEVDERALGELPGTDGRAAESPSVEPVPSAVVPEPDGVVPEPDGVVPEPPAATVPVEPAEPEPAPPPAVAAPPPAVPVEPPAAQEPPAEQEPPAAEEPPAAAPPEEPVEESPVLEGATLSPSVPAETPPTTAEAAAPLPSTGTEQGSDPVGQDGDAADAADEPAAALNPLLTTGVLASALLGALILYRWRKMARRRHRRTIVAAAAAETESDLRAGATADVERLDRALRLLALGPRSAPTNGDPMSSRLPDVGAVWIGEGEIHLILASPAEIAPPEPFHRNGPAGWFLPEQAELPAPASGLAPLPTLVTIGTKPGQHLLIDLERMGMLTVFGPAERGRDLLRYLVAELVHNPWSERAEVTLVGLPAESAQALASLAPERITVADDLPEAVRRLRRRLDHTTGTLSAHRLIDAVHGRVTDTHADTWSPQLLIVDQPGPEYDELLSDLEKDLTRVGRRAAVAVVVTAPQGVPYGRRTISLTEDGLLRAGFLDESHPLPAAALPAHLLGPLAELLRDAATGPDHPIPPATESWAGHTDATGGTVREPVPADETEASIETWFSGEGPAEDRPAPADPDLDEAFAEWQRDSTQPPRIAILGPVRVVASGPAPTHRPRLCQELVVYLAARGEQGADTAELTNHLWPGQPPDPAVRTAVLTSARRWLGNAPDGEPWLTEAGPDGRYRLRSGPLVDWHLFRRLRTRGEQRGMAGIEDLKAALWLVRGAPLADVGELASASTRIPYSWLPQSTITPELILAGVVDTAHQLVDLCLAVGDLATAHWAVRQAWLADPRRSDDHPWRDLLRIRHAEQDHEQLRAVVTELLQWRDAEHPDELTPATRDLIRELVPFQSVGVGEAR